MTMVGREWPAITNYGFDPNVVGPIGTGTNGILLVGEAPGESEAKHGEPFWGMAPAGGMLSRLLKRGGWQGWDYATESWTASPFKLVNTVWQRPPNNVLDGAGYEAEAIEHWRPALESVIGQMQPKCIVTLGNTALKALTGYGAEGVGVSNVRGYVLRSYTGHWLVPTFHPSYIVQGGSDDSGVFIFDVTKGSEVASKGWQRRPVDYLTHPSLDAWDAFVRGYNPDRHVLAWDIETPESTKLDEEGVEERDISYDIIRISFSYEMDKAASVPWSQPYLSGIRQLLESNGVKRTWNGRLFDTPRVKANGITPRGKELDLMWCLHGQTKVRLADGTWRSLKSIVDAKEHVRVSTMNALGKVETTTALLFHRHVVEGQKWIYIKTDGTRHPIICTPDHKIYTKTGWKRADQIALSDWIPMPRRGSDDLIHGTILGDGYVSPNWSLQMLHSSRQQAWIERKARHLDATITRRKPTKRGVVDDLQAQVIVGKRWRKLFYPDGKKVFIEPPSFAALAVWYCDDGNRHTNKNCRTKGVPRLCVHSYNEIERERILAYFHKHFGKSAIEQGLLTIKRGAAQQFYEAIADFVPPEMQYKLPDKYRGRYNGWLEESVAQWAKVEVVHDQGRKKIKEKDVRYCITVSHPMHAFFTEGGLVSNCWHFLQPTLRRSLGFVTPFYSWAGEPWKHLSGTQPEWYSAADADATWQNGEGIERDLRTQGLWQRALDHVVETAEVLTKMSENGLPYDQDAAAKFEVELQGKYDERLARLQELVPIEVCSGKQKNGYKKAPKGLPDPLGSDHLPPATIGDVTYWHRAFNVLGEELNKQEVAAFVARGVEIEPDKTYGTRRWVLVKPFNPGSSKQKAALAKHWGYKLGKNRKTKQESADDDALEKIIQKCRNMGTKRSLQHLEAFVAIRECMQLQKVLGTYVKGWRPGRDGRIHATPGFWGKMYRISWRKPNIAATVADKKEDYIAAGFRKCVRVPVGRILCETDWKGMEAVLVGYFADDSDYIRLARLGVHDYFCAHLLVDRRKITTADLPALSWSDTDLKACFKSLKNRFPADRDDAKHTVHGISYGMTPPLMVQLYDMTMKQARTLQGRFFELFPKVRNWQKRVMMQAYEEAHLRNPFGYNMAFWDVFRYDTRTYERLRKQGVGEHDARKQAYKVSEDAKSALSFLPRDTGAAMLKEVLLRLERDHQLASRGYMLSSTHDSILTESDESEVDMIAPIVKMEMERPVPELGGLWIGVDQVVGVAWDKAAMADYKLPSTLRQGVPEATLLLPTASYAAEGT